MSNSQDFFLLLRVLRLDSVSKTMDASRLGKSLLLFLILISLISLSGCAALGSALGTAGKETVDRLKQKVDELGAQLEERVKTVVAEVVETVSTKTEDYLAGVVATGQDGIRDLLEAGKDASKDALSDLGSTLKDTFANALGKQKESAEEAADRQAEIDAGIVKALEALMDRETITEEDIDDALKEYVTPVVQAQGGPVKGEDSNYWRDLIAAIVGTGAIGGLFGLRQTSKAHTDGKQYARAQLMQMLAAAKTKKDADSTPLPPMS